MSNLALHEIANAVAAIVSAVGGCFAAVAAFRSARSAQDAAKSGEDASHRASLRELSGIAASVVSECISIKSIASELTSECRTAEVFSGSAENAALQSIAKAVGDLVVKSQKLSADAELFCGGAFSMKLAPSDEVDRVIIRMSEHLTATRAFRDELLRKHAAMFSMNSAERSRRLSGR